MSEIYILLNGDDDDDDDNEKMSDFFSCIADVLSDRLLLGYGETWWE